MSMSSPGPPVSELARPLPVSVSSKEPPVIFSKVLAGPSKEVIDKTAKINDWNDYKIRCEGNSIKLWLNGTLTVNYTEKDEKIETSGVIALQVHGGGKTKVMYKDNAEQHVGEVERQLNHKGG